MQSKTLSVTDLNEYVRRSLAGDPMLVGIAIHGEISNFKHHTSGHLYFTLKDAASRIACVMFRQHAMMLKFLPQDGMRVILSGSVGLYTASGSYQFYGEAMAAHGQGSLYEQFLQTKERLQKEGLFDASSKQALPLLPKAVGILTAKTGAVLHDIINVTGRRFPGMQLILRAARVQGEGAAQDLVNGLYELSSLPQVEVIIIGRGGGSLEDLWAFNEELLVRAVADCKTPVISAVGHETDLTLTDYAADVRAPTPSAAAELAIPSRAELLDKISMGLQHLTSLYAHRLGQKQAKLDQATKKLLQNNPERRLHTAITRHKLLRNQLQAASDFLLEDKKTKAQSAVSLFVSAGPKKTLQRGYVIAYDDTGKPVQSVKKVSKRMRLQFIDGQAEVQTIETTSEVQDHGQTGKTQNL